MKKLKVVLMVVLFSFCMLSLAYGELFLAVAHGKPFLAGDPPLPADNVTESILEVDGVEETPVNVSTCYLLAVGCTWVDKNGKENYIYKDLSDLDVGQHTFRTKWVDDQGVESEYSLPIYIRLARSGSSQSHIETAGESKQPQSIRITTETINTWIVE